jgi:hypothetical protein
LYLSKGLSNTLLRPFSCSPGIKSKAKPVSPVFISGLKKSLPVAICPIKPGIDDGMAMR